MTAADDVYNQLRVPAILRSAVLDGRGSAVAAGTFGGSTPVILEKTDVQVALFLPQGATVSVWCTITNLLPYRDFLLHQPKNHFWALAVRTDNEAAWMDYLASVDPPEDGGMPFRFESEGELRYYVQTRKLYRDKYQMVEFKLWN